MSFFSTVIQSDERTLLALGFCVIWLCHKYCYSSTIQSLTDKRMRLSDALALLSASVYICIQILKS